MNTNTLLIPLILLITLLAVCYDQLRFDGDEPTKQAPPQETIEAGMQRVHDVVSNADSAPSQQLPHIIFSHGYTDNITHLPMLNEGTKKSVYVIDHPSIEGKAVHDTITQEALPFFNHYVESRPT